MQNNFQLRISPLIVSDICLGCETVLFGVKEWRKDNKMFSHVILGLRSLSPTIQSISKDLIQNQALKNSAGTAEIVRIPQNIIMFLHVN